MAIIDRVKGIILSPAREWDAILSETPNTSKIITGYVLPLALVSAAAAFIGCGLIGVNTGFFRMSGISWGLYYALNVFVSALLSVYIGALIIDALAPSFSSEKNLPRSVQLMAYANTPALVGGILAIIPLLSFVGTLFSLYGLYLLYLGLPKLKRTPAEKQTGYFVAALLVSIVVYLVLGAVLSKLLMPAFGVSMSMDRLPAIDIH